MVTDPSITIGGITLGPGPRTMVIAEVGVNHNGSEELARLMVERAVAAGADAVKFQSFKSESLVRADAPQAQYQRRPGVESTQLQMLKALELSAAATQRLARLCTEQGTLFLSTPYDEASLQELVDLGVAAIKIASTDTTNLRFVRRAALTGKPVLLSTGMSDGATVRRAVAAVRETGNEQLLLFQCTSSYPAPVEEANLAVIERYRRDFHVVAGFSDHTASLDTAALAVAAGARAVERHFTTDKGLPGPDHAASLDEAEFRRYVASIRAAEHLLGSGAKTVTASERENATLLRRGAAAATSLPKGHVLRDEDVLALRPVLGLPASEIDYLIGRRLRRSIAQHEPITKDAVE